MVSRSTQLEQLQSNLALLIQTHRATRIWFWRTGAAALAAAFLWILIYLLAPDNMGVTESLAIIIGAFLMWILFLWSFFLMRKLNRLTDQVKNLEDQLLALLAANNRDQPS
ncbi:MAG: LapA family protein [Proteobacteria bacterium]|nr:LapA family protein [Pseudomonadota bacterium]